MLFPAPVFGFIERQRTLDNYLPIKAASSHFWKSSGSFVLISMLFTGKTTTIHSENHLDCNFPVCSCDEIWGRIPAHSSSLPFRIAGDMALCWSRSHGSITQQLLRCRSNVRNRDGCASFITKKANTINPMSECSHHVYKHEELLLNCLKTLGSSWASLAPGCLLPVHCHPGATFQRDKRKLALLWLYAA